MIVEWAILLFGVRIPGRKGFVSNTVTQKNQRWGNQIGAKDDDACLSTRKFQCELCLYFCCSSDEEKVARNRVMARRRNTIIRDAHSPLAAYRKCHIYESKRYCQDIRTSGMKRPDDEPAIVNHPLLSSSLGGLLLFLLFDFGGLRLDFASAGKRSMN